MTALTANCIDLNIQGNSVYAILKQLANMALQNGYVSDRSAFLQTLLIREKLHSTGFGSGIAVPHGKSACITRPFVLFARKSKKWTGKPATARTLTAGSASACHKRARTIRSKLSAPCAAKLSIKISSTN